MSVVQESVGASELESLRMGDFQNQGMGMAVGEMQDYESDSYNIFDHNAYSHTSSHMSSIEPLDLDEIPVDEFSLVGDGGTVEENNYSHTSSHMSSIEPLDLYEIPVEENIEYPMGYSHVSSTPESGQKCEVPLISTLLSPSESYVDSNKEPIAKRPRTVCCYTIEDVIKNLPRSSSVGNQEILQNGFQSDINSGDQKMDKFQLYRDSGNRLSVEPQGVAARHRRRKIQGKIRSLEKLVPLKSKLDMGTMLEEASKYVKFLQAQLRVLELMPSFLSLSNGLGSARTLNPPSKNNVRLHSTSSAVGKGIAMSSNGKVEEQRAGENLSDKEMLHLLVTSRAVQRILLSQEKCFGTIPNGSCCGRYGDRF